MVDASNENLSIHFRSHDGSRLVICRWPVSRPNETKKPEERAYDAGWELPEGAIWNWILEHLPAWCLPSNDCVQVVETETGRERIRVRLDDGYTAKLAEMGGTRELRLSGDGSTLISVHQAFENSHRGPGVTLIRIWDVHPRRPWLWAIGSALALGMGLLLLRRWRLTRKAAL